MDAALFTMIDHVGIAVADLDAAIAFYRDTYGMQLLHEETNAEQGVREAMMAVGSSGSCIQLLAPLSPDSPIGKFLARSGPGIQQMAYRVEDIDAVCATLRERGVTAGSTSSTPRTLAVSSSSSWSPPPARPSTDVRPGRSQPPDRRVEGNPRQRWVSLHPGRSRHGGPRPRHRHLCQATAPAAATRPTAPTA
jgi:methylmalonyl-CoA/ethylmalonyl-CoA epimerase